MEAARTARVTDARSNACKGRLKLDFLMSLTWPSPLKAQIQHTNTTVCTVITPYKTIFFLFTFLYNIRGVTKQLFEWFWFKTCECIKSIQIIQLELRSVWSLIGKSSGKQTDIYDELIHIVKWQHDTFCIIPSQTLSRTKSNQLVHLKQMRIKLSFVGGVLTPIQNNYTFFFNYQNI